MDTKRWKSNSTELLRSVGDGKAVNWLIPEEGLHVSKGLTVVDVLDGLGTPLGPLPK